MTHKKNVLTIAGSDSSGGAGIQADLKTFEALKVYGASVISSITSQNTLGVQAVFDLPDSVFISQLKSVFSDIKFDAVKIGMLKSASYIEALAEVLSHYQPRFVVMDPVMISSSGQRLMEPDAIKSMEEKLYPLLQLLTPNIPEASVLLNKNEDWINAHIEQSAKLLLKQFNLKAVLLKGGHGRTEACVDTLAFMQGHEISIHTFSFPRIATQHTHGTGCTLSSAIASFLAKGFSLPDSTQLAGDFVHQALLHTHEQQVGRGKGPLNHSLSNQ